MSQNNQEMYLSEMMAVLSFRKDVKDRETAISVVTNVFEGEDKELYEQIISPEMMEILHSALDKMINMSDEFFKLQIEAFNAIGIEFDY